jgi:hypothetical protein
VHRRPQYQHDGDRELIGKLPLRRGASMPSENYRYYCLDAAGHLYDAEWLVAESAEDAVEQIKAKHPDSKCEIWQGKHMVAAVSPVSLPA